jgi:hypothetical protein
MLDHLEFSVFARRASSTIRTAASADTLPANPPIPPGARAHCLDRLGLRMPRRTRNSHRLKRWQPNDKLGAGVVSVAFETAAQPAERSSVEVEPALAERSRINLFPT